jgi:hypothetical protein
MSPRWRKKWLPREGRLSNSSARSMIRAVEKWKRRRMRERLGVKEFGILPLPIRGPRGRRAFDLKGRQGKHAHSSWRRT